MENARTSVAYVLQKTVCGKGMTLIL